ncbi:MAG: class I SAM-dependent methyltransferase [Magnetococcales bacterium]|nr:class I SAM-dependent methyltransferase [Magnetococcales bacterium]
MDRNLLPLLRDPVDGGFLRLQVTHEEEGGGVREGFLIGESGRSYSVLAGVPRFLTSRGQTEKAGIDYAQACDPAAKWKNAVRRYPLLTRILQVIFDPAWVSHATRDRLLQAQPAGARVLNLGAGVKRLPHVASINLDLDAYGNVDLVADGAVLPLATGAFDGVVMEYVIEHVADPDSLLAEVHRILKPGGFLYLTVPFLQAYHGNPDDYHRFTRSGLRGLLGRFEVELCQPFGGPASALVCMVKEFFALCLSFRSRRLYAVLAQLLIIPLFPIKFLDLLLARDPNAHAMAFSLECIGRKRE